MQVCDGPQLCVRLLANITTPAVELSTDFVDFGLVKCGECNIVSVQLYNAQPVTCHWDSTARKKRKVSLCTEFLGCLHQCRWMRLITYFVISTFLSKNTDKLCVNFGMFISRSQH